MYKHQIFMELHKFYYSSRDPSNPLPYRMQHAKNVEPDKLFTKSRLRPMSYLECPVPVYHLQGDFYISTRTLAGMLGTFLPWISDDPNDQYKRYREFKRFNEDRVWTFAKEKGWTESWERQVVTEFTQYPAYQQSMVNRTATWQDHRNLLSHVAYFSQKDVIGIIQIDDDLHKEIKQLMGEEQEVQPYNSLTKYFLMGDHRLNGYLVNKEGANKLLLRYAAYNLPKQGKTIRLMQKQLDSLLGQYKPHSKYREVQATISCYVSELKALVGDVPSSINKNAMVHLSVACLNIRSALLAQGYIKKVSFKSDRNWHDRILLDRVSNDDVRYEEEDDDRTTL